jgi:hypothetical protein
MNPILKSFLSAADHWVCDNYAISIRYIAIRMFEQDLLLAAAISSNPLPPKSNLEFHLVEGQLFVGEINRYPLDRKQIQNIFLEAGHGRIEINGTVFSLLKTGELNYFSETNYREKPFYDLHLNVGSSAVKWIYNDVLTELDNRLRCSAVPFDGLVDVSNWLGFEKIEILSESPRITINVGPPVDLRFEGCKVENNRLQVLLHAHPELDITTVGLAVRVTPGFRVDRRAQIASNIKWEDVKEGKRAGTVSYEFDYVENALVILTLGRSTIRRHWFFDISKSQNQRQVAMQLFDRDFTQIKKAVLETHDANKFEKGVAALLYLLGFNPCIQLETDAPDIVVTTPQGRLVLVECTTKISDFQNKLGKLVDRRGALVKALEQDRRQTEVTAVLICGLPEERIHIQKETLKLTGCILLCKENLARAFGDLRLKSDPDKLLSEALQSITEHRLAD